jgi:hypothetical protein
VVAQAAQGSAVESMGSALSEAAPHFTLRHTPWSLSSVTSALKRADLVLLPQDHQSDWGRVKSHNRLVETIRAGRFAIASAIPSYLELSSYAWVGNDLASGVEWALRHRDEALLRIARGQDYVADRFAPARIASHWAQVLGVTEHAARFT